MLEYGHGKGLLVGLAAKRSVEDVHLLVLIVWLDDKLTPAIRGPDGS
jgi:hypothetical protein